MNMAIDSNAPFLQGPGSDMVQDGAESGSSDNNGGDSNEEDDDSQTKSDQDDSGDESGDGDDDDDDPMPKNTQKRNKGQQAKMEPCEEMGGRGSTQINFI